MIYYLYCICIVHKSNVLLFSRKGVLFLFFCFFKKIFIIQQNQKKKKNQGEGFVFSLGKKIKKNWTVT